MYLMLDVFSNVAKDISEKELINLNFVTNIAVMKYLTSDMARPLYVTTLFWSDGNRNYCRQTPEQICVAINDGKILEPMHVTQERDEEFGTEKLLWDSIGYLVNKCGGDSEAKGPAIEYAQTNIITAIKKLYYKK